jgi:hypothetical protein
MRNRLARATVKNYLQHTHALVRIAITEHFALEAAALTT